MSETNSSETTVPYRRRPRNAGGRGDQGIYLLLRKLQYCRRRSFKPLPCFAFNHPRVGRPINSPSQFLFLLVEAVVFQYSFPVSLWYYSTRYFVAFISIWFPKKSPSTMSTKYHRLRSFMHDSVRVWFSKTQSFVFLPVQIIHSISRIQHFSRSEITLGTFFT